MTAVLPPDLSLAPHLASTALLTDHYELTMLHAALRDGTAQHRAVFEVFARSLPEHRGYGVVAGLGRLVEAITAFRFTNDQIAWLRDTGVADDQTAAWLADYRFTGDIDAYDEGELYFPQSPVFTVEAPFGEAVLLETLVLSILNHDSAIASAAARMVHAAGGRALIEMGSRRTGEQSAVAAARAAYLAGFTSTSNLEAGLRYGVPTAGTAAHAFVLAHRDQRSAFASQVAALGAGTTLLVDTYDIADGIRTAIDVAGPGLGGIRIDSGDLAEEVRKARVQLDYLGAEHTRIVVSGDLDEYGIAALRDAPVDAYGAGTKLVTGSGHPTAGMVYKLVAIADGPGRDAPMRSVAKRSIGKASLGGRKTAFRDLDALGHATRERVAVGDSGATGGRPLQVPVIRGGEIVYDRTLGEAREHHRAAIAELLPADRDLHAVTRLTATEARP